MAERRVRQTGKDDTGAITTLCYHGQPWSPRTVEEVIDDIDAGLHRYFVQENGVRMDVTVIRDRQGVRLRTTGDPKSLNHLGNLPDA